MPMRAAPIPLGVWRRLLQGPRKVRIRGHPHMTARLFRQTHPGPEEPTARSCLPAITPGRWMLILGATVLLLGLSVLLLRSGTAGVG